MTTPAKSLAARAAELEAQMQPRKPRKPKPDPMTTACEWHHREDALPEFGLWIVVVRHEWEPDYGDWNEPTEYALRAHYAVGARRKVRLSGADGWEWDLPKKALDFEFWSYLASPTTRLPRPDAKPSHKTLLRERIEARAGVRAAASDPE